ncbi:DUF423 domain-containing protein [Maribacter sp. MMG018]|uniref:DUF423 domain-containing protein n=1 Tax=Maribacter sp. MMG018 TaxID=2822688 RepID=UPI001B358BD0|nr:DUF423 domain-containing protein [Maribacter sp. MMG018]MBQ4913053.1 DUF423 domain-containing protein [Maribacter sp. MMG018]
MKKTIFVTASVFGLLAVMLGAFGAHGLEKMVNTDAVATFETGVRYQMYHAFFLFVVGLLPGLSKKTRQIVYTLVVIGIVLFSFSIYLLALNDITTFDFRTIGIITPIGGVFLLMSWGYLGYRVFKEI